MLKDSMHVIYDMIQAEPDDKKFVKMINKLDDKWNEMANDRENLRRVNNMNITGITP